MASHAIPAARAQQCFPQPAPGAMTRASGVCCRGYWARPRALASRRNIVKRPPPSTAPPVQINEPSARRPLNVRPTHVCAAHRVIERPDRRWRVTGVQIKQDVPTVLAPHTDVVVGVSGETATGTAVAARQLCSDDLDSHDGPSSLFPDQQVLDSVVVHHPRWCLAGDVEIDLAGGPCALRDGGAADAPRREGLPQRAVQRVRGGCGRCRV
jgi:hypothetical protein